jgi:hypothetical protein
MTESRTEGEPKRGRWFNRAGVSKVVRFTLGLMLPKGMDRMLFPEESARDLGDGGLQTLFGSKKNNDESK